MLGRIQQHRAPCTINQPWSQISVRLFILVCHQWLGATASSSFNSKLAVLVSEPDVQIKKVRHAHLILVNLPPSHLASLSASVWQQPSQTHAFALWVPTPPPAPTPFTQSSCSFPSRTDIYVSLSGHRRKWNIIVFPKNHERNAGLEGTLDLLIYF